VLSIVAKANLYAVKVVLGLQCLVAKFQTDTFATKFLKIIGE